METKYDTEHLIEQLMIATYGGNVSVREQHAFKEALRGLVRLAKAEQMLEMRKDIRKVSRSISCDALHSYREVD